MYTLQLKINDKVYEKFLWLLSKFNKDEIEILSEKNDSVSNRQYFQKQLNDIVYDKEVFYSVREVEEIFDKVIDEYEANH